MLYFFRYLNNFQIVGRLAIFVFFLILIGCSPTKYVPDDEYLLNKYNIDYKNRDIKKDDLERVIKQKPNKRILGLKFHLSLYNLSRKDKDSRMNRWLKTIGEEPVIYDEFQKDKSSQQLKEVLSHKGYFNAHVEDTVSFRKKKAKIVYTIHSNKPYRIRKVGYNFEDTTIQDIILADSLESLVKKGKIYNVEVLQLERNRLEKLLKNEGYYTFSKHYVHFEIDSSLQTNQLDIDIGIKKFQQTISGNRYIKVPHQKFSINKVYVYTSYNPQLALTDPEKYNSSLDTAEYQGLYFITSNGTETVKPKVVYQSNYIKGGELYNLTNVEQTNAHLSSLQLFRLINIQFREVPGISNNATQSLDCIIQLAPFVQQSYTVELEGTNSAGNLGGALNLLYQHRNLFKGSEVLNLKLKGALETLTEEYVDSLKLEFKNTIELGAEVNLTFPKFLLPFLEAERFVKKYNPKTTFSMAYNYQRRPVYTRTLASASIGYNWKSPRFSSHIIRPFDINAVRIDRIDESFEERIKGTYLENSYQNVLINGINYSYVFNNQNLNRKQDFIFLRMNAEAAGNLVYAYNQIFNSKKTDSTGYELFGLEDAQFAKADFDIRYNQVLNESNDLVYRVSVGAAYPYGNSSSIPFTRQYFTGGANGIRAWHVRSLGPGSTEASENVFFNQTADIKLEANLEYRFKLFWILEGAMFIDAGNIWTIKKNENLPERYNGEDPALFQWNKFYKDLAVGTGLGLRFDFSFFIFRLDMGMKVRDPGDVYSEDDLVNRSKWIPWDRKLSFRDDFTFHIAIGYPF
jgi:outer membrane translocation and assembly module TamA